MRRRLAEVSSKVAFKEKICLSLLPPTYFAYGTRDPLVGEFEKCIDALKETGVTMKSHVLERRPHGFGY
ncbi:alpha/beta hydrolase fold domain-containing protein [Caldicellulosiruptoraceae bacterium PP1]